MNKPIKHTIEYYDYYECVNYINKKYKVNIDDFAGHWGKDVHNPDVPFQSFWQYIVDTKGIHNGCYMDMYEEWKEDAETWQIQIIDWFLEEFGYDITFYVSW